MSNYPKSVLDLAAVFEEAKAAAKARIAAMANQDTGACGFAWVTIRPARGPFITWCKSKIRELGCEYDSAGNLWLTGQKFTHPPHEVHAKAKAYGQLAYGGGWRFYNPADYLGQAVHVKEAGAEAFAEVLQNHGIDARMGSRLD